MNQLIRVYDRKQKTYFEERVVGESLIRFVYENPVGKPLQFFLKRKFFSALYGGAMDSKHSRRMIDGFIRDNGIDMSESFRPASAFGTFNEFFIRKLKPDARPFDMSANVLISPADSRLLAFQDIDVRKLLQVKGLAYALSELVADKELADSYAGGTALVFRLCPLDYHRFHFVDSGIPGPPRQIQGMFHSVNPIALRKVPRLYVENKRCLTTFESDHFGKILYVEVGAMNVGSILQTFKPGLGVHKGEEKGYFKFGGSTVILFLEKGQVRIHEDILALSRKGTESRVLFGESIGEDL